ncbi:pseudouridine synthase [Anaeromicropila populeti]|uniref:Pseudouridine synthase n=1 Tax=Anaeromicropila populeti TaxID=37658 RepID=A0A1I6INN0_9FIRM|nr:pseudouridine synthase [Anaeromicropila populeti]SFR68334.1 23S rRNA pseudouridine2604 synthase [Anaeromicropila populeti]
MGKDNLAEDAIRLNKYMSDAGFCSRREADRLIEQGKVTIDGQKAALGDKIFWNQIIAVNGREIEREEKRILIAFHKPRGIVCTTSKNDPDNIVDYIHMDKRIYPIGRLDKDSEGLILLTNKGDIVDDILRGSNHHEKEYVVTVNKKITSDFVRKMEQGVPILDTVTRPCKIEVIGDYQFKIVITQGLNRQIRRMCEYFEYRVIRLRRVRIMNILLGNLKEGTYRGVTDKEFSELKRLLKKR